MLAALTLHPIAPYRLDLILAMLARFPAPTTDRAGADGAYWRALAAPSGRLALWRVTKAGEALHAQLIAIDGDAVSPADLTAMQRDLAHVLAIDDDPRAFYAFVQADPALWQILAPLTGTRWLRTPTVFEALVMLIIEQHISWAAAQKYQRALLETAGAFVDYGGSRYYAYPAPAQLATLPPEALSAVKITDGRKRLLLHLAAEVASGRLALEALRELPPAAAYRELLALKGIGHWTAANVVMRALGGFPYVPDGDVALQLAANVYFHGVERKLTPAEMRTLFARYGDFAGAVAYHTLLRWVLDRYPVPD